MFKQILFSLVKQAGIEEAKVLLLKLKDSDADNFLLDVKAAYLFFKRLAIIAEQTKTNIDDTLAAIWVTAIEEFSSDNNISL